LEAPTTGTPRTDLGEDHIHLRLCALSCGVHRMASRPHHLPPQLPWLILPREPDNVENIILGSSLSLYNLSQSKSHVLDFLQILGKYIRGSSHGWLVLEKEKEVWLFNPITRNQITLPSLSAQPKSYLGTHAGGNPRVRFLTVYFHFASAFSKALLSSYPTMHPNFLVPALIASSWKIAFCRIGDECWTTLTLSEKLSNDQLWVSDISYHNGFFFMQLMLKAMLGLVTSVMPVRSTSLQRFV
jgi:hypothetical protein